MGYYIFLLPCRRLPSSVSLCSIYSYDWQSSAEEFIGNLLPFLSVNPWTDPPIFCLSLSASIYQADPTFHSNDINSFIITEESDISVCGSYQFHWPKIRAVIVYMRLFLIGNGPYLCFPKACLT